MAEVIKSPFICEAINDFNKTDPTIFERPISISQAQLDEAWQQGYDEGLAKGMMQAHQQLQSQIDCLSTLLKNMPTAVEENRLALSSEISDIVLSIVQRFFMHQHLNKEAIAHQISHTLSHLNQKHQLELRLHPHDLALLQQGEIKMDLSLYPAIRITSDETLNLGGCIIRTEHGLFNASIERQIDDLKKALLKPVQRP